MAQPTVIHFYRPADRYGEFSNFARFPIRYQDLDWPTSEALFQACKFPHDPQHREKIRTAGTPSIAAALGRSRDVAIRPGWDQMRDRMMYGVQQLKFDQHPQLRELLLSTGDAILVERSHKDHYWGDGGDGTGLNKLGLTLMHLRDTLRGIPPAAGPQRVTASLDGRITG